MEIIYHIRFFSRRETERFGVSRILGKFLVSDDSDWVEHDKFGVRRHVADGFTHL
jgi:hypothetical protein